MPDQPPKPNQRSLAELLVESKRLHEYSKAIILQMDDVIENLKRYTEEFERQELRRLVKKNG